MKERGLTSFQHCCETALKAALANSGLALESRELAGKSETYIRASVSRTDVVVYIYGDEAQFHRQGKIAGLYEHQDYSSPEQLQKAFVDGVMEIIHAS